MNQVYVPQFLLLINILLFYFFRKHDYENYLCTLLLPKSIRRAGFAIRAFNIEVATIQDQISDVKIGEMRFKFWESSLAEVFKNKTPKHPVLIELYIASTPLLFINQLF